MLLTDADTAKQHLVTRRFHSGDRVASLRAWAVSESAKGRDTPFKLVTGTPTRVVDAPPSETLRTAGLENGTLLVLEYE